MEKPVNPIVIERDDKDPKKGFRTSDVVTGKWSKHLLTVTISPAWSHDDRRESKSAQVINAKQMLVLNLNNSNNYGHIYTEVFSELLAVDETYPDCDCILVAESPLMTEVIESFRLKLSPKIKFIRHGESFVLESKRLKVVNHSPMSYVNKIENVRKLKATIHAAAPVVKIERKLLLYCSRAKLGTAKHGRRLNPENENQVIEILKQHALENGLDFYLWNGSEADGSKTSILKQYELFSSSQLVVGPHGGAFSNIIFLDPSKAPRVIEFCPFDHKSFLNLSGTAFSEFADYRKISYQLQPAIQQLSKQEIIDYLGNNDSTIDLSEMKRALER